MLADGIGERGPRRPRNAWRTAGALVAALMLWSAIAAPPTSGQDPPIEEPSGLAAYSTFADGSPIQLYFDHQARLVPLGPALAHSQSEVSLPSAASSISWLIDGGVANGLHGTTTGAKVPTEASAKQPGGESSEEFRVAGGPIGDDNFLRVEAGRAFATARHSENPRGYATSYLGNILVLPAAGSPPDPPGTYDPNATFPGGEPGQVDPAPRGQMGILSIGSIASTAESIRDGSTVRSIAVAEVQDVNIGNRTSDNRCTNCIRIDSIRAEAYAQTDGTKQGAQASYRVILGRACRRAFNAESGQEEDRCLPLDPHEPAGTRGLHEVEEVERFNDFFSEPIWVELTDGQVDYMVGIRIHAGDRHRDEARSRRTSDPPDDVRRNYAEEQDGGEVAKAVAEGIDVEIWTITMTQVHDDAVRRLAGTPAGDLLKQIDEDDEAPGIQISGPGPLAERTGQQTIPTDQIRSVRRLQFTLGVARTSAVARTLTEGGFFGGGFGARGAPPGASGATTTFGGGPPAPGGGEIAPPAGGAPVGITGPLSLRVDWSSFRIRPWAPYDMFKAIVLGAIAAGVWWLARKRFAARAPA